MGIIRNDKATIRGTLFIGVSLLAMPTFADITIDGAYTSPVPDPALVTSVFGNVTVTDTGSVTATGIDGIEVDDNNRTIINSGNITSDERGISTFALNTRITNNQGATITSTNGGGIFDGAIVSVLASNGSIDNYGTVRTTNDAAAVFNFLVVNQIFNNEGIIESNGTASGNTGGLLFLGSDRSVVNNAGIIRAQGDSTAALALSLTVSTDINNTGTIFALNPDLGGLAVVTAGTIWDPTEGAVFSTGNLFNHGIITNGAGGKAIDFQTLSPNQRIVVVQEAGTITGDVLLGSGGGELFFLNGGVIMGDVLAGNMPNTLALNAGTITGTTFLGSAGDTLNLVRSQLQAIQGGANADTFNIDPLGENTLLQDVAPTFTSLDGGGGEDSLNINGSFRLLGPVSNIHTITIPNAGTTFTTDAMISGVDTLFSVSSGALLQANSDISGMGTLQNEGSVFVASGATVNLENAVINDCALNIQATGLVQTSNYIQDANASFLSQINNVTDFGQIQAGNAGAALSGSVVPYLGPGPFIPPGSVFPVVHSTGNINDTTMLSQPTVPWVFFTKEVAPCAADTCLNVTLELASMPGAAQSAVSKAVAGALEGLIPFYPNIDPDILAALGELQRINTIGEFTSALESLAPSFNYGIVKTSHMSVDSVFETLQVRMEDLRRVTTRRPPIESGHNLGDLECIFGGRGYSNVWVTLLGMDATQQERQGIEGYSIDGLGIMAGADWQILSCAGVGVAMAFTTQETKDKTPLANKIDTQGLQGIVYGWFEPYCNVFVDAMIGAAFFDYDAERHIGLNEWIGITGANFSGAQYGAQSDIGYVFTPWEDVYIAPIVRLKYTYLHLDDYTEAGAGGLSLRVAHQQTDEAIAGIGFRAAAKYTFSTGEYVPELFALLGYDFSGEPLGMNAQFLGGGAAFLVDSILPPQSFYLFGASVNAHTSRQFTVSVKYNLEVRDQYVGNSGTLQVLYGFA